MKNHPDLITLLLVWLIVLILIIKSFKDFKKEDYYRQYKSIAGFVSCVIIEVYLSVHIISLIME